MTRCEHKSRFLNLIYLDKTFWGYIKKISVQSS